jgi:hypothetical protein
LNPAAGTPSIDGRQGFWSLSNDHTGGVQTPSPAMIMSAIPGGRGARKYALHTTSFTGMGALVGVDLNRKTNPLDLRRERL